MTTEFPISFIGAVKDEYQLFRSIFLPLFSESFSQPSPVTAPKITRSVLPSALAHPLSCTMRRIIRGLPLTHISHVPSKFSTSTDFPRAHCAFFKGKLSSCPFRSTQTSFVSEEAGWTAINCTSLSAL
jgi:hypothetical protein